MNENLPNKKLNLSENRKESNNELSESIPPRNQSNKTESSKCKVEFCLEIRIRYVFLLFTLQIIGIRNEFHF